MSKVTIRPMRPDDVQKFKNVVESVYGEYEPIGVFFDINDTDADMQDKYESVAVVGGGIWMAELDDVIVGGIGVVPAFDENEGEGVWELTRFYALPETRGTGTGKNLLARAEEFARSKGAKELISWSDTRFQRSHSFYKREGFVPRPETRALDDLSKTVEYCFRKSL